MMAKRGKLSNQEIKTIEQYAGRKTDKEIAKMLNRTEATVRKTRVEKLGLGDDIDNPEFIEIRNELRSKDEYKELKEVLTKGELEYAERQWAKYLEQFKQNVLPTEETQILQLIKFEIFQYRIELQRKQLYEYMMELKEKANKERTKRRPNDDKILAYMAEIPDLEQSIASFSKNFVELQKEHAKLLHNLKATRDQRIKNIHDSGTTILGHIKALQEKEFREKEEQEMELMRAAMDVETKRLGGYHEYMDGTVDQPLLNSDTVEMVDRKEEEDE